MSNKRLTNSLQLPTAGQVIPRIGPLHHLISGSMPSKLKTCNVAIFKIIVGMTMFYMFALGNHIDPLPTLCFGNPKPNNGAINASLIHYYLTYSRSNSIANPDREMLKTVI